MNKEQKVAEHYGRKNLEAAILEALKASGKDPERLVASDLSGADEFHLGWRAATVELAQDLGLRPGLELLDVGSGIGGPARYFAEAQDCRVTGIDLTAEFVETAAALTRRCGLTERVTFKRASALDLPFAEGRFDVATLIHVGMNIDDKERLFAEVRRVLKAGGRFGVYDVMRVGKGEIVYPMPWAETSETSFVATPDLYRELLAAAGFEIEREVSRADLTLRLAREMRERAEREGPPALSLHLLMGPAMRERIGNVMAGVTAGTLAPVELVARAL